MTQNSNIIRAASLFALTQVVAIAVAGMLMTLLFKQHGDSRAIMASAVVAFVVQMLTFAIMKVAGVQQLMAAWGIGVLVRFAVVLAWAFLLIPALGLAPTTALLSLVVFLFISTLIEPLFLNS